MKVHEYQAKEILRKYNVNVPIGKVVADAGQLGAAFDELHDGGIIAVKSQIHAGGRGKGTLYDGENPAAANKVQEGGVKIAKTRDEALEYGGKMLGNYLHTIQTGETGKKVLKVYLERGTNIKKEFYLSMLLDRGLAKHIIMASTEGGMEIEEVAAHTPEKIIKVPVEAGIGLQPWQARHILFRLGLPKESLKQGSAFLMNLWKAYQQEDASMLEINPLVQTDKDELIALDCKFTYDDNALYRHPETGDMRDLTEEDPLEVKASEYNLNYVKLDGNVGCMVNGAGLAMATMDIVKLAGAEPANFLDVGGGANVETVSNGFRIILGDPNVKAIFVNIFGGIVQCDRVANGIVEAAKQVNITVPLIVRLQGTNAEIAREILEKSGVAIIVATTLKDGAEKVGAAIKGG
ncbi:MAG: ADP-forming succinate--CoA ligase subunit beta [Leptospiraceae bacterium]|nr:ADP-forming succinate--CoA ligase subunit beta [Leptospiraceae bacterium]